MVYLDDDAVRSVLKPTELIAALASAFRSGGVTSPTRSHHSLPGSTPSTLLIMPAWQAGGAIGVKVVTVAPKRSENGLPCVDGAYMLLDAATGKPSAMLAARALTAARTAAVSALAASYLAPKNAATLLMIGTGNLSTYLIEAHCSVRPIERVLVWGRDVQRAEAVAAELLRTKITARVEAVTDLKAALGEADVICCATSSDAPLVLGSAVAASTHVDLVGSFTRTMREADDALFAGARVFVDTMDALHETGDLISPCEAGILHPESIKDLATLISDSRLHRHDGDGITIFKAVGTAIADFAAAQLAVNRYQAAGDNR